MRSRPRPPCSARSSSRRGLRGAGLGQPGIGSPQLTVGLIKGGINTNVVPDRVTLRLDRRLIPEEQPAAVEAELREVIAEAARAITGRASRCGASCWQSRSCRCRAAQRLGENRAGARREVLGERVGAQGVPLYTDARHYAEAGVPIVLYGAGPRTIEEANAHRADERLPLAELPKATKVVALALLDLLGG